MTTPLLIRFYDPTIHAPDNSGHTLPLLLSWPDPSLERSHTYIQTLFPLPEPSPFNPSAPVITREIFLAFRTRPDLRNQLLRALVRMCQFYGFDAAVSGSESVNITRSPTFSQKARQYGLLTKFSHNHLRITRIIRSLRVLGCEAAATAFHGALVEVAERYPGEIGERSLGFWRRAVERPLWVRPEDEDEGESERMGGKEGFLWEFEAGGLREELGQGDGEVDGEEDGKVDVKKVGKEEGATGEGEGG